MCVHVASDVHCAHVLVEHLPPRQRSPWQGRANLCVDFHLSSEELIC